MRTLNFVVRPCFEFLKGLGRKPRRRSARRPIWHPAFEQLELRANPSAITATFSGANMTITGDIDPNSLTIQAVAGDPTKFALSSSTGPINGVGGSVLSPTGIQNITIKMLGGADTVSF